MSDQTIPINVWLCGRSYRIRIKPNQEEIVRRAVKVADDQIMQFKNSYAGKDDQDFMAMCLLSYALDNSQQELSLPLIDAELKDMMRQIDDALDNSSKD